MERLRILALATEWGTTRGGVSTWNRELCLALSDAGHKVVCALTDPPQPEPTSDAEVKTPTVRYGPPSNLLGRRFDVIVGNGLHTGAHAQFYAREYFKSALRVHVQHVDHTMEHDKTNEDSGSIVDRKERASRNLLRTAEYAIGVGPRLASTVTRLVASSGRSAGPTVLRLDPGIPRHLLKMPPRNKRHIKTRTLLVVGRTEDWKQKGLDLAARIAARLYPATIHSLRLRGAEGTQAKQLKTTLRRYLRGKDVQIDIRPFRGPADVVADLEQCDCVLLPSRREGFGLSALESLAIGVPTLVASNSGIADVIRERCNPDVTATVIVDGNDPEDWAERVKHAIDPRNLELFLRCRTDIRRWCSWKRAARALVDGLGYGRTSRE